MASSSPPPTAPQEGSPGSKGARKQGWSRRAVGYACWVLGVPLVVLAFAVAGISLHFYDSGNQSQARSTESAIITKSKMALALNVTAERVDLVSRQVAVSVLPIPQDSLADNLTFTTDVQLTAPGFSHDSVALVKGTTPTPQNFTFALDGGPASDYPLDTYGTIISLTATAANGDYIPVSMDFSNDDPFFEMHPTGYVANPESAGFQFEISRALGTWILVWFMIAIMWALALAVFAGALVLVRKHEGLVWPALGWMAATLFALVGLRNAAPGSPPIGSVMDYAAFFWAEGIITASLAWAAAIGFRDNRRELARRKGNVDNRSCCRQKDSSGGAPGYSAHGENELQQ